MLALVEKEFVQLRRHLIQSVGFFVVFSFLMRQANPSFGVMYLTVFTVVFAITMPQMSFALEERGKTFGFLRTLPIDPAEIVGAKYVATFLVIALLQALAVIAGIGAEGFGDGSILLRLTVTGLISIGLLALSLFLHFWLGLQTAKIVLMIIAVAGGAGGMLVGQWMPKNSPLGEALARAGEFGATTGGFLTAVLIGLLLLLLSFAASTRIFSRRDLSRLS